MNTITYRRRRFFFAPLILVVLAAFSVLIMALWNVLMPVIFHLPVINFWQAAGLLILSRLLFGIGKPSRSWPGNYWKNELRNKISKMSPEERREFFRKIRCNHGEWHKEYFSEKEPGNSKTG